MTERGTGRKRSSSWFTPFMLVIAKGYATPKPGAWNSSQLSRVSTWVTICCLPGSSAGSSIRSPEKPRLSQHTDLVYGYRERPNLLLQPLPQASTYSLRTLPLTCYKVKYLETQHFSAQRLLSLQRETQKERDTRGWAERAGGGQREQLSRRCTDLFLTSWPSLVCAFVLFL